MNKTFYLSLLLVHFLLFISFQSSLPFWIVFTLSFICLSIFATIFSKYDIKDTTISNISLGLLSGIGLYFVFLIGKQLASVIFPIYLEDISHLYNSIAPVTWWHYIALFLIIIPGEELFWRGFIQKRLSQNLSSSGLSILSSAILYTSANLYAGNLLFLLATLVGGILWGALYVWKRNIVVNIISHLIFDLLLIVIFPIF
ncbi:CPBP family intramembrane glutamic endopeptidase [Ferdinandcohnia quinoae]|uniref:CPBP family intramembrane metalloprotease n=1 Tax=Fredinandcohnia quinoae TaxID=2918902 RepID=A0AAW5ED37_9BACI|nr:CPBP family intramembrane glutamic endopeptidase [Fredinandcohnia sp. SECRCQ15]MCH1627817.1 CPBP family intramembrane metalloprotease [Fredinandcohnia sp. SECRCQ15]